MSASNLGGRQDRLDHGRAERARRQRPAGDLRAVGVARVDAGAYGVEQALTDAPAREAVELDRQRVVDLVLVAVHGDAEALAQERAHRALDELTSSSSVTRSPSGAGGSGSGRNGGGSRRGARKRTSTGQRGRVEAPRPSAARRIRAAAEVARVEGLQRVADHDLIASAASRPSRAPERWRRSRRAAHRPGPPGGSGAFVRSSLPL